jgi:sugar fermentation stimulation protein A
MGGKKKDEGRAMKLHRIADRWEAVSFVERPNRFTLVLESGGKTLRAYLPNTGRLEEYLVEGHPFFVVPFRSKKFSFRVVSTLYHGCHILLDTIAVNDLAATLIEEGFISGLGNVTSVHRERTIGSSRFDFIVERTGLRTLVVEVKTCTLSHNGVAMFPDAPSLRARTHLAHLGDLRRQGYDTAMFFIIPNARTERFVPNVHTDPEFSEMMLQTDVNIRAFSLGLVDPVRVDLNSVRDLPVDLHPVRNLGRSRGSYLLVLENNRMKKVAVGSLGEVRLPPGFYVYVGSGMGSLAARAARHYRRSKKHFWHIDYLSPEHMKPVKLFVIRRSDRIEPALADRLKAISSMGVGGFGSSDSRADSHLFFFEKPPFRNPDFMRLVLDFRTFTEQSH